MSDLNRDYDADVSVRERHAARPEAALHDSPDSPVEKPGEPLAKEKSHELAVGPNGEPLAEQALGHEEDEDEDFCDSASMFAKRLEATIPDGGPRAWAVVIGSFCAMVITFGVSNGTGTIQDYLLKHQLSNYSESDVGWIFSVWLFFIYFGGVQTGPVFDAYGLWPLLIPGCIGWVAALFILSVCKQYYQFMLGFSVLGGLSASMLFNPAITVLGHWFLRHRSLVTGFAAAGGSAGGIFIPLMLQHLFPQIGYGWSIRVLAFILMALAIISCLTMRSRHMKRQVNWREAVIDLRSLRDPDFFFCCVGVFLVEWGVFVPIIYLVSYARAQGLSNAYANALLAYLNVGSCLGRIAPGYIADRLGNYNVTIITSAMAGIMCIALWIPAGTSKAGVTAFAVLFGFWSGSTISLVPVCVSAISTTANYGKRYGTAYSIASIAALTGLPIAGALTAHNYLGMKVFSGVVYIAGAGMFAIARWIAVKKKLIF